MIRYICDLCKRQIVDMDGRPVVIAFRSREVHLDDKVYYMHFHLFCAQKFLPLADIRKREEEIRNRNNGKRLQNYMNRLRAGEDPKVSVDLPEEPEPGADVADPPEKSDPPQARKEKAGACSAEKAPEEPKAQTAGSAEPGEKAPDEKEPGADPREEGSSKTDPEGQSQEKTAAGKKQESTRVHPPAEDKGIENGTGHIPAAKKPGRAEQGRKRGRPRKAAQG